MGSILSVVPAWALHPFSRLMQAYLREVSFAFDFADFDFADAISLRLLEFVITGEGFVV